MESKCTAPTSIPSGKIKRNILSLKRKLEVIEEHEHGKSRAELMEKYGLKKTTIHDILKAKDKIRESVKKLENGPKGAELFRLRKLPFEGLDEAVFQWYKQQRAKGVATRGLDIQYAAEKLAACLGHQNFKCSDGWLWRFKRRHGIVNKAANKERLTKLVNPFTDELKQLEEEELHHFHIYNAEEAGLLWHSLPRNTQAKDEEEEETPCPSLAAGIDAADTILSIITKRGGSLMKHYEMMRMLRLELVEQQQQKKRQLKITDFFKPVLTGVKKKQEPSFSSKDANFSLTSTFSTNLGIISNISSPGLSVSTSTMTPELSEEFFQND